MKGRTMRLTRLGRIGFAALAVGLTAAGCANRPESLGSLRARGDRAAARGDHVEALAAYRQILERRPGDAEVRYREGLSRDATGDIGAARESFTVAHDLEPENPIYLRAFIASMLQTGERDEAFTMLQRRAQETEGYRGYLELGRALREAGLPDDAERALVIASRIADHRSEAAHWELANLYLEAGDSAKELERLRVLLYLTPDDPYVSRRIRDLGEIPGPSLSLPPDGASFDG